MNEPIDGLDLPQRFNLNLVFIGFLFGAMFHWYPIQ